MARKKMEDILNRARLAIEGTLNDEVIQTAVTPYGYNHAKMLALKAQYDEVQSDMLNQASLKGKRAAATAEMVAARAAAQEATANLLSIARREFRTHPDAIVALGLRERRKQSLAGFSQQSHQLYKGILTNPAYLALMTPKGYNATRLTAELTAVEAVGNVDVAQESAKGQQQKATKERDAKLVDLDRAISDYKAAALIALANDPQQLEKLGFGAIP